MKQDWFMWLISALLITFCSFIGFQKKISR